LGYRTAGALLTKKREGRMVAPQTPISPNALPLVADTLYAIARGDYGPLSEWEVWIASECGTKFPFDTAICGLERALQHVTILPACSHTYAVLVNRRTGRRIAFEAVWPVVRVFDPAEKVRPGHVIRYNLAPLDASGVRVFCLLAAPRIGRGYDVFGLWLAAFFILVRRPNLFYLPRSRIYCVALIAWLLKVCGHDLLPGTHADNATPAAAESSMDVLAWRRSDTPPFAP